ASPEGASQEAAPLEAAPLEAARAFVMRGAADEELPLDQDEATSEAAIAADDDAAVDAATELGAIGAETAAIAAELAVVDAMLDVAKKHAARPDARVTWLIDWIRANMAPDGRWNERRLILFTEFEDTRRWLQKRLLEALDDTDRVDERMEVFSGATGTDRREAIKRAFNADPAAEPLRILICTDAAREGVNLQMRCHDLIHIDLPWNPSRLEQRNGRIDRKLQPSPEVYCRYFRYAQREEDIVLEALAQKSETIASQLGSAGRVLGETLALRLAEEGIGRGRAAKLAESIRNADAPERLALARAEMDDADKTRQERLHKELDDLRKHLERSRERVGVDPRELRQVVGVALSRVAFRLDDARSAAVGPIDTFRLDPQAPMFADDPSWGDAFDDLRDRRRKKGERLHDWRRRAPVRAVAFEPPVRPDGTDAADVVQVHLEHRLVRRLLARFLSQGFQADLERACVVVGPGAQPRVVMLGRLAVYGPGAVRLHEEIIPVTAVWTQAERDAKPLKPFGASGEETTMDQLQDALRQARDPLTGVIERIRPYTPKDAADLRPELERRAASRLAAVTKDLAARGEEEANALAALLSSQADRIVKAVKGYDPRQFALPLILEEERRQKERERRRWDERLAEIERERATEPARVRDSYAPVAHRLEPVGLVYLWPASN
ncbi:MAG TPA: helicase-related protein, partial [Azospirillaceae bacterium]|nr:helicase-related protein [Azospirillaceae bacterium]